MYHVVRKEEMKVFELPMRDGNILHALGCLSSAQVFELPMRDGNLPKLKDKLPTSSFLNFL